VIVTGVGTAYVAGTGTAGGGAKRAAVQRKAIVAAQTRGATAKEGVHSSENGVHPSTAQKMLGHSDIRMTLAIYTHATDGMQDAATAALEEAFS
jgi:integrase